MKKRRFLHLGLFCFVVLMEEGKYAKELDVAVRVVHMACSLCQRVQEKLVSSSDDGHVKSKDDDSPVTVAGVCIELVSIW